VGLADGILAVFEKVRDGDSGRFGLDDGRGGLFLLLRLLLLCSFESSSRERSVGSRGGVR
jgi:hypothetical protein